MNAAGVACHLDELYRQLFNPQLYLLAYGRIYSNKGAMTPGAGAETADGMTLGKIERIIDALRHERYRFRPVRRHYIPKKDGKQRALGLPSWSDKLLGEVMRVLLEAYYEPQFSDHSHGYRPDRGCHTALSEVVTNWTGTTWFIEGDISRCIDELDHQVMLQTLGEKIQDNRFVRLVSQHVGSHSSADDVRVIGRLSRSLREQLGCPDAPSRRTSPRDRPSPPIGHDHPVECRDGLGRAAALRLRGRDPERDVAGA